MTFQDGQVHIPDIVPRQCARATAIYEKALETFYAAHMESRATQKPVRRVIYSPDVTYDSLAHLACSLDSGGAVLLPLCPANFGFDFELSIDCDSVFILGPVSDALRARIQARSPRATIVQV